MYQLLVEIRNADKLRRPLKRIIVNSPELWYQVITSPLVDRGDEAHQLLDIPLHYEGPQPDKAPYTLVYDDDITQQSWARWPRRKP